MLFKRKILRTIVLASAILAFIMPVYSQDMFVFEGKRKQQSIAFKKSRGLMVLQMFINNKGPFNFILDTGVGSLIITDTTLHQSLDLKHLRKVEINGLGEKEPLIAYITPFLRLQIGNAIYKSTSAAILKNDVFNLSAYFGMSIHGLIGYDFFKSFIVKINYDAGILKVYKHRKSRLFKLTEPIPINLINNKPYIQAKVTTQQGAVLPLQLLVDNGSGVALSLESFDDHPFQLPKKIIPANLGVGLSGNITGFKGRVNKLRIADYSFKNLVTAFPRFEDVGSKTKSITRNGSLGSPIFTRFKILFDYQQKQMYLISLRKYNRSFDQDKSGLELITTGENFKRYHISRVDEGSAGAELGMLPGDEIISVNFTKTTKLSLEEITKIFSGGEGKNVFLEIGRGTEISFGVLKLKKMI